MGRVHYFSVIEKTASNAVRAGGGSRTGVVRHISLAEFTRSVKSVLDLELSGPSPAFSKRVVLKNARRQLGPCRYDLLDDNCQHFANECWSGNRTSQVEQTTSLVHGAYKIGRAVLVDGVTPSSFSRMLSLWGALMPESRQLLDTAGGGLFESIESVPVESVEIAGELVEGLFACSS